MTEGERLYAADKPAGPSVKEKAGKIPAPPALTPESRPTTLSDVLKYE